MFLAVSVVTMVATPFIIAVAPRVAEAVLRLPLPNKLVSGFGRIAQTQRLDQKNHIIIIGFGLNGRNVARAARAADIPYVIVEMNAEIVRTARSDGEPIFHGDAVHDSVLRHVNIKSARVVVVAISDDAASRRIVTTAHTLNTAAHIVVRTRHVSEVEPLYSAGANEVIPEEFETSIEIFTRVLMEYLVPHDEIERFIAEARADGYKMFRGLPRGAPTVREGNVHPPDIEISVLRVDEKSPFVGKSLEETALRETYDVTVVAVLRNGKISPNPRGDMQLECEDDVYLLGMPERIAMVADLFEIPPYQTPPQAHERDIL